MQAVSKRTCICLIVMAVGGGLSTMLLVASSRRTVSPRGSEKAIEIGRSVQPSPFADDDEASHPARVAVLADGQFGGQETPLDSVPFVSANASEDTRDRFLEKLDSISETYLTDRPDLEGLSALLIDLARSTTPDETSIRILEEYGLAQGVMRLPGSSLTARFVVNGDKYTIELESPTAVDIPQFMQREVSLTFQSSDAGIQNGSALVQFHIDTRNDLVDLESSDVLKPDQEIRVGWTQTVSASRGTIAVPLTAKWLDSDDALIIGKSQTLEALNLDWSRETTVFEEWRRAIRRATDQAK